MGYSKTFVTPVVVAALLAACENTSAQPENTEIDASNPAVMSKIDVTTEGNGTMPVAVSDADKQTSKTAIIAVKPELEKLLVDLQECRFNPSIEQAIKELYAANPGREGESRYGKISIRLEGLHAIGVADHYESKQVFFEEDSEALAKQLARQGYAFRKYDYSNDPTYGGPRKIFWGFVPSPTEGYSGSFGEPIDEDKAYGKSEVECGL